MEQRSICLGGNGRASRSVGVQSRAPVQPDAPGCGKGSVQAQRPCGSRLPWPWQGSSPRAVETTKLHATSRRAAAAAGGGRHRPRRPLYMFDHFEPSERRLEVIGCDSALVDSGARACVCFDKLFASHSCEDLLPCSSQIRVAMHAKCAVGCSN